MPPRKTGLPEWQGEVEKLLGGAKPAFSVHDELIYEQMHNAPEAKMYLNGKWDPQYSKNNAIKVPDPLVELAKQMGDTSGKSDPAQVPLKIQNPCGEIYHAGHPTNPPVDYDPLDYMDLVEFKANTAKAMELKQLTGFDYGEFEKQLSANIEKELGKNYFLQGQNELAASIGVLADSISTPKPPEEVELVELTISGLSKLEAEKIMKQVRTNEKPVLTSKKVLKDIGTGAKAIITWDFESSSTAVNGAVVKYITQLNTDGTLSCQCNGWTIQKRDANGVKKPRECKHTRALDKAYDMKDLFKKWKKGEPLGADFAPKEAGTIEIKTLGSAAPITYTSKRIVEI